MIKPPVSETCSVSSSARIGSRRFAQCSWSQMTRASPVVLAAILCLPLAGNFSAQERPAIVEGVDLLLPMPPTTVRIGGKTNVVYELHITNFLSVDISLSRLQVFSVDRSDSTIADYRDEEVRRRIGRPGLRRGHESPHVIGPGMRAVAYLWIELADDSAAPPAVRHRVELDILRLAGVVHAIVEGAASPVSIDAPVVLNPPLRGGPWTRR